MAGVTNTETPKPPSPREFAENVLKRLAEDGTIAPAADGASKASATPVFSKGTVALDDETGRPIIPKAQGETPAFVAGTVEPGTETPAAAAIGAPAPVAAEPVAAAPAVAPEAAQAGATAVEAAAQQIAEEFEDWEFDEPDLGVKVPLRVPKKFAETVKRGYGKRAAADRAAMYLRNAEPTLRQLIEDGRIQNVLPLIQAALENEEYGTFVTSAFQRLREGKPLVEQALREAAAAGVAQVAPEPAADPGYFPDPVLDEVINARMRPVLASVEQMQRAEQERQAAHERQAETQRQQEQRNAWLNQQMQSSHHDLARMFPGRFDPAKGPADPAWNAAVRYANEAGYTRDDAYGVRAGIVFGGQQFIAMDQERVAATSSPAAAMLAQADNRLVEAARREASASAAAVSGGGVAQTQMPAAPAKPTPKDANGALKPREQYMAEVQAWHQQYGRLKEA